MTAIQAGIRAYREQALVPLIDDGEWDDYAARLFRYYHYETYYLNTVYSRLVSYAAAHKERTGLYKHVRSIYNPVSRQNDLLSAFVYGGSLDMEHMTGGAIPLVTDNEALLDAARQLFTWSRWGENKQLYVRWGARLGDVAIKIVDDRQAQRVRMEIMHPSKIREAEFDAVGNVKAILIEYEREDEEPLATLRPSRLGASGDVDRDKTYVYTERITQDKFETFKNGEPFAFYTDASGTPVTSWANEYGFVPVVIANHTSTGLNWGANSFHNTRGKIDEINDAASLINDQVRKSVNLLWYFAGVRKADELTASATDSTGVNRKDIVPAIYGPADSQPYPMIGNLPIADALSNLQSMISEIERDMPELALQRIREQGNVTAPGVRAQYSDAIGRIQEARGNYDHAQVRAIQMAVSIGGYNRYRGFETFNLGSYDAGDMELYIKDRPVIGDSLSTMERIGALQGVSSQTPAVQRLILRELNFSENDIEDVIMDTEVQARNALRGFADSVFGTDATGDTNDEATQDQPIDEQQPDAAQIAA